MFDAFALGFIAVVAIDLVARNIGWILASFPLALIR